jgi:EAL domain-containing protein (putative c-di-GMP-specific phosphodiesterase class I)
LYIALIGFIVLAYFIAAEGVENAEALALLEGMGCDQAQGYHLSRPLPLDGLIDWLHAR